MNGISNFVVIYRAMTTLMVGDEVSGWNPFLSSMIHLANQLEELGVVYAEKQAIYVEANRS